jgi:hypothetical protein
MRNIIKTSLDVIKETFQLKRLEYLPFHYNSLNEYEDKGYLAGYKGLFGPPIYKSKRFYQAVFQWTTSDGINHKVAIFPKITGEFPPIVDTEMMLDELRDYIKETLPDMEEK